MDREIKTAFVTGATGLLGNNLVRMLVEEGIQVKALVRSTNKAQLQFDRHPSVEIVVGDMTDVASFATALSGCDTLFHTAAYYRDSYCGGRHWSALHAVNVEGTEQLLAAAYKAGIKQFVHTSSIAVIKGNQYQLVNETMKRDLKDADDYYRSKILADEKVCEHLEKHPDSFGVFVMPGWMHGPGDMGPTSAGQFTLDFLQRKLPGIPPATFAFVDARDVARAAILALKKGRRGEHYLAAGQHTSMAELMKRYEQVTGIKAPQIKIPIIALWSIALIQELFSKILNKPALLSLATLQQMRNEYERSRFDHSKSEHELGLSFRSIEETIADEVTWYQEHWNSVAT